MLEVVELLSSGDTKPQDHGATALVEKRSGPRMVPEGGGGFTDLVLLQVPLVSLYGWRRQRGCPCL